MNDQINTNRKKFYLLTATLLAAIWLPGTGCGPQKQQDMITTKDDQLFPKGEKITNGYFTGQAYLQLLLQKDHNHDFVVGSVSFEPGARTNWHTHPRGQVLLVTEGAGLYQELGKAAKPIRKGDVINIPENVQHWHGASSDTGMTHIAITNYQGDVNAVWLEPVDEKTYQQANQH